MADKENTYWHILVTRSRFEKKCKEALLKNGYEVFLPLQKQVHIWSDRKKIVEMPLFSGYLFVNLSFSQRDRVLQHIGVSKFVRFNNKDALISNKEINAIKEALIKNEITEVTDITLHIGENIKIITGPFKGFFGKLIQLKGKGRILVELNSLGKALLLEIGNTRVEKTE